MIPSVTENGPKAFMQSAFLTDAATCHNEEQRPLLWDSLNRNVRTELVSIEYTCSEAFQACDRTFLFSFNVLALLLLLHKPSSGPEKGSAQLPKTNT